MFYTACYILDFVHYQLVINLLQSKIRSIEALQFPKKLIFRAEKKAMEGRQALLYFLSSVGLCELQICLAVWAAFSLFFIGVNIISC